MDMGAPYMVFVYMPKKHQKTQLLKLKTWTLDDDFGSLLMQRNNYKVSHVTYAQISPQSENAKHHSFAILLSGSSL